MPRIWTNFRAVLDDCCAFLALEYAIICGVVAAAVVIGFSHFGDALNVALAALLEALS